MNVIILIMRQFFLDLRKDLSEAEPKKLIGIFKRKDWWIPFANSIPPPPIFSSIDVLLKAHDLMEWN